MLQIRMILQILYSVAIRNTEVENNLTTNKNRFTEYKNETADL